MKKMYWASTFSGVGSCMKQSLAVLLCCILPLRNTLHLCCKADLRYFFWVLLVNENTSN